MFLYPDNLILLLLVPFILIMYLWTQRRRQAMRRRLGDEALLQALSNRHRGLWRAMPGLLWLLAFISLVIASARPAWGVAADVSLVEGISVMFVLDVSRSMDAEDISPSRLERARLTMNDLLVSLGADSEFGIVVFAGAPYVYLPLTSDMNTARIFIEDIHTGLIPHQGTALQSAIEAALGVLDVDTNRGQMLVILTDGENHIGDPLVAAYAAQAQGVPLHIVGYGTQDGALIPDDNNEAGFKVDIMGEEVVSELNADLLQTMADITGGTYQLADGSGRELTTLLNQVSFTRTQARTDIETTQLIERFHWFVLIALVCLLVGYALPEARPV